MRRNIQELTSELIRLPKRDRLEIARFILFLDSQPSNPADVSSSWEAEILDRVRAVEDGTAVGIEYDKALKQLEARFTQ